MDGAILIRMHQIPIFCMEVLVKHECNEFIVIIFLFCFALALVGGPNLQDEYEDVRNDAVRNEVAVDYNAAFQGCIAALQEFSTKSNAEILKFNYQVTLWLVVTHVVITF